MSPYFLWDKGGGIQPKFFCFAQILSVIYKNPLDVY